MTMDERLMSLCSYRKQEIERSSLTGRHFFVNCDESSVTVYQAFCPEIADYAITNGHLGGRSFVASRGTWLKTSFMMVMFQSKWAKLPGKKRILAIRIRRQYFEKLLELGAMEADPRDVDLFWNHDYSIYGSKLLRSTLLLFVQPWLMERFNIKYIEGIQDITRFVKAQRKLVLTGDYNYVAVPEEILYKPQCELVVSFIMSNRCIGGRNAMLLLQGSFNPVHTQHIQMLKDSRDWVEQNTPYTVVAGVLTVNTDEFLQKKFLKGSEKKIKFNHRLQMCRIAADAYEWIHVFEHKMNAPAVEIKNEIENKLKLTDPRLFCIYGADRAMSVKDSAVKHSLFVGREGQTQQLKERLDDSIRAGRINPSEISITPFELPNISSTYIRENLDYMASLKSEEQKVAVLNQLSEAGYVDPSVGEYLLRFSSDLFLP